MDMKDRMTVERDEVSNLLGQRFTYFITFFAIIIGGAIASWEVDPSISAIVLFIGSILLLFLKWPIESCAIRLNIMMELIYRIDKNEEHPTTIFRGIIKYLQNPTDSEENNFYKNFIDNIPESKKYVIEQAKHFKSRRDLLGFTIPNLCLKIIVTLFICNMIFIIINIWLK